MEAKHNILQRILFIILVLCAVVFAYMWYGPIGTKPDDRVVQEKVHAYYEAWSHEDTGD